MSLWLRLRISFPFCAVFKYGNECPRNLTLEMDQCTSQHLGKTLMLFHRANDLVVDGNTRNLKRACR